LKYLTFPITESVLTKKQIGERYDLDKDVCFIYHKAGFCFISNYKTSVNQKLLNIILKENYPKYTHIYDASVDIINFISDQKNYFNTKIRNRIILQHTGQIKLPNYDTSNIQIMNVSDMESRLLEEFPLELFSRYWNGKDDFITNSMGVVIMYNQMPACICYGAAIDHRAEIDIFTFEKYRKKNLAKIAASVFVNNCKQNNIIPNWDCFAENEASIKTAQSLGFNRINEYSLLSIYKL
jgi:hypothetical protein